MWFVRALLLTICAGSISLVSRAGDASDLVPYLIPIDQKVNLQALLDLHHFVVLEADRDYRSAGVKQLRLASGDRIEGGWNTRIPALHVPAGTSSIYVAGVRGDATLGPDIVFEAGAETHDVTVIGGNGGIGTNIHIKVDDGARLNRVRLSEIGGLEVDQQRSGYIRNSVVTRLLGYWPGPQVTWQGNSIEPSGSNVILGFSSITPAKGSHWSNAGDLALINWDCESWNQHDQDRSPCFVVQGSPRVTSVALSGGTADPEHAGAVVEFRDIKSLRSWFFHAQGGRRDAADAILDNVGAALTVQSDPAARWLEHKLPTGADRLALFEPAGRRALLRDVPLALGPAMQKELHSDSTPSIIRSEIKPVRRLLQDPFARGLPEFAHMPDSASQIQADIDRTGIVRLPAGRYFLDRPLRIGSRNRIEGILGDSIGQTVLVAKGDFAVIEGRGDLHPGVQTEGSVEYLVLDHVMLYGGRYGLSWTSARGNLGDGGAVAFSTFNHVVFVRQRLAGVNVEGIHGLDSNTWSHTDFYQMPVAIRGDGHGSDGPMNYADKQSFVDCQFQEISDVVWYWTADRASGGEIWTDAYFYDVGQLTRTRAANGLLWVNNVMENVTGSTAIEVTDTGSTSTNYFTQVDCLWTGRGPRVVTDSQSNGVGTVFVSTVFEQKGGTLVAQTGLQTLFAIDSMINGSTQLGHVTSGVFIDSKLGEFDDPLEVIVDGRKVASARRS